jgi:hypothetical protein
LGHESTVAYFGGTGFSLVEDAEEGFAAAIADFIEDAAVGTAGIDGFDELEIGSKGNEAGGVAGGEFEIDDVGVSGGTWVKGELDFACEEFVGARQTEGFPVLKGLAVEEAKLEDAGLCGWGEEQA